MGSQCLTEYILAPLRLAALGRKRIPVRRHILEVGISEDRIGRIELTAAHIGLGEDVLRAEVSSCDRFKVDGSGRPGEFLRRTD